MKPNHLFTSLLGLTALLVTSCSTPKLAQNSADQDDVYNTTAQAKEYKPAAVVQNNVAQNTETVDDYYGTSDPYYDMDYTSRIQRFYYGDRWRGDYFSYLNYYGLNQLNAYSPFYYGYYGGYYDPFFTNPFYNWSYYGYNPYRSNFWGPFSYGGLWGNYYGNYYNVGGGYGSNFGNYIVRDNNYNARPNRGGENGVGRNSGYYGGGAVGLPTRSDNMNGNTTNRSRAEMYNPTNSSSGATGTTSTRPSRGNETQSRPTRTNDAPPSRPQPTYNPPVQQSAPPASSGGGRAESSGGGGGGGGGRPTRGGGR